MKKHTPMIIAIILTGLLVLFLYRPASASPMGFCWEKGTGDIDSYLVEVSDQFGQLVISTTTTDTCFSFDYEGALRVSVTGINDQGELGPHSDWSVLEMSDIYKTMVTNTADILGIPRLSFVDAWSGEILATWSNPHENN